VSTLNSIKLEAPAP